MTREIINTYEQLHAAGGGVAICPANQFGGSFTGWYVLRVNAKGEQVVTDAGAHWSDHGKKWFSAIADPRGKLALAKAKAWVAEQGWYSGPWKRNAMRDYVPAAVNAAHPLRKRA